MENTVISLRDVHKTIAGKEIIKGLSFDVKKGEVYGFLGPNGSGKTTTIRMITSLISITKGEITICGYSIVKERELALAHIGAIVENPELYEYMTGMQNLRHFANMATVTIDTARIHEIVKLVNLENAIDKKVKTYSLGMKQRLGIAQALLHDPDVLVLDEPTNGLDPAGIRQLRDYLQLLAKEKGIAVLVSSHLLSEIELMCDRVVIIQNGQCVKEYSLKEEQQQGEIPIIFEVDDPRKVAGILHGKIEEQFVRIMSVKERIPELIKELVLADVRIYTVRIESKTLEDQFLTLTEGVKG